MKWFRFYEDALNDPKVQHLPAELFKVWVNLLCVASKSNGTIPDDMTELAFIMRATPQKISAQVEALKKVGLLDQDETLRPHNWTGRQYESDNAAVRMRRHRQRHRDVTRDVTPPNKKRDSDVPDTDSDSEKSSVTKVTGATAPISDQDRLWRDGPPYLKSRAGIADHQARSIIGRWLKANPAPVVLSAISRAQAEQAVDPVSFVTACLKPGKSNVVQGGFIPLAPGGG